MKKLLIIIFCLLISGCNNYRELNNIAVVSALGIDYKDNMYNVSVLVKDNAKNDENKTSIYTYEGKSLDEAIKKVEKLKHLDGRLISVCFDRKLFIQKQRKQRKYIDV